MTNGNESKPANNRELSLKLLVVLSKAYKVIMDRAMRDMKKYGLSATEFTVLELLYHKGKIPLQQIGDKILVTSGSITYNIDKLEKKGYLKRVPCSEDRRVTYAVITDAGTDFIREIFPDHADVIESIMGGLTPEEKADAIVLLKKLGLEAQKIE
ncbi:MarR family winged helix-turn-helix transcriptional regulator [Paenibacillus naphthalenovorans]|uniref:MarR family winged helix-turn-helix transcriptional regulator n=1 Tax=Paenibacillus naphthalenovorans TaxID=162209 RepID=UPI00088BD005|nr:MarR family transcriptional regulator [Paenibacillus naphthalenovorans]SDI99857.1 MarR family transcriptional regulator, 2-MHQ and catechol-resistance regulon repressor [Paenibacillus naphthalenovorans]